jgi:predicted RNA methylase
MPRVRVGPLPAWMPIPQLLGPGEWAIEAMPGGRVAHAELDREVAADIAARLRGLGFGGHAVDVVVVPPLKRSHVRAGRTRDARARRDTTPGFTRSGARLDDHEGHRSLTPEALALALGERARGRSVLDLTCGAGGNAIGFARAGCPVTAVERDPRRLDLARHNAGVYGVADRINFVLGDALNAVRTHAAELAFVDPPWQGWDKRRTELSDLPLLAAILADLERFPAWWVKVPPSFEPASLGVDVQVTPWFGVASGDRHRVKFLVLERDPPG